MLMRAAADSDAPHAADSTQTDADGRNETGEPREEGARADRAAGTDTAGGDAGKARRVRGPKTDVVFFGESRRFLELFTADNAARASITGSAGGKPLHRSELLLAALQLTGRRLEDDALVYHPHLDRIATARAEGAAEVAALQAKVAELEQELVTVTLAGVTRWANEKSALELRQLRRTEAQRAEVEGRRSGRAQQRRRRQPRQPRPRWSARRRRQSRRRPPLPRQRVTW